MNIPGDIGEGSKMQVADNAQRFLLLRVIDVDCVLSCDSIYHTVAQTES